VLVTITVFSWRGWGVYKEPQLWWPVTLPRFKPGQMQFWNVTASLTHLIIVPGCCNMSIHWLCSEGGITAACSSRTPTPTPTKRAPKNDPPGRLDGKLKKHKLVHISPTINDKTPTRKCQVCAPKNLKKETRFLCVRCGVPLHPEGCYTLYHTLKHFEGMFKFFFLKSW
jgi:hypothetical protein